MICIPIQGNIMHINHIDALVHFDFVIQYKARYFSCSHSKEQEPILVTVERYPHFDSRASSRRYGVIIVIVIFSIDIDFYKIELYARPM